MGEKSIKSARLKTYQIAVPTEFGLPDDNYRKYHRLNYKIKEIMGEINFLSTSRRTGKYDENRHLFYIVFSRKSAKEIKRKITDAGLAKKVHINKF